MCADTHNSIPVLCPLGRVAPDLRVKRHNFLHDQLARGQRTEDDPVGGCRSWLNDRGPQKVMLPPKESTYTKCYMNLCVAHLSSKSGRGKVIFWEFRVALIFKLMKRIVLYTITFKIVCSSKVRTE